MSRTIRIAAISVATVDAMVRENYARALRLGEIALRQRPDIVLFPEAFAAGYCGGDLSRYAETLDSEFPPAFARLSKRGDCVVVFGFLERRKDEISNAVAIYDRGTSIGLHRKSSLWCDAQRPYRDEVSQFRPGKGMEVFEGRFGPFSVVICYENMLSENWNRLAGRVGFVLSPYNCEGDPSHNNLREAKRLGIPSAWADRTGTVFTGNGYAPNLGTAGLVNAKSEVIARSAPGVEAIVVGELTPCSVPVKPSKRLHGGR